MHPHGGMSPVRYAFYGDDFTGATDTLATLAGAGLSTLLFLGVPEAARLAAAGPLDALGIAGAARSMDADAMRAELAPVARFLAALAAPVSHYKCCSTFDSAPGIGNLALAASLLTPTGAPPFLPVVGGQPNLGRYCAFGNLFAAAGDGAVHRLDRHPTMHRHPVTPMHEADLRRHFAALGLPGMGLVDWRVLEGDPAALDDRVRHEAANERGAVLFDVLRDDHLRALGRVLDQRSRDGRVLAVGPSSVAQALVARWRDTGTLAPAAGPRGVPAAAGPVMVLAGSRSPVTAAQVAGTSDRFARIAIDPARIVDDAAGLRALAMACATALHDGRHVLAHTTAVEANGPAALAVARACGRLLAATLAQAPHVRRVGIAGGDTSSLAVREMDAWALGYVAGLAAGVPLVKIHADDPPLDGVELMLKGGQMGPPDLFDRLVDGTA